jgi:methylglutaconyl-CoA hydratase
VSAGHAAAVRVEHDGAVSRVVLSRPERHNALDPAMIDEIAVAVRGLGQRPATRLVVLAGDGPNFCAGADIAYMRALGTYSAEENLADARRLGRVFLGLRDLPKPVVARVHGAALGGGAGLVAASDIAVAAADAVFGFTEARLGILPAVISPFVVPRIGVAAASEHFLTGARFGAERAREIGLVSRVVPANELDAAVDALVTDLLASGPEAQAAIKRLLPGLAGWNESWLETTAHLIAERRSSAEGREGLQAFLSRRRPAWAVGVGSEDGP